MSCSFAICVIEGTQYLTYRSKHKHDIPIFLVFINTTTFLFFLICISCSLLFFTFYIMLKGKELCSVISATYINKISFKIKKFRAQLKMVFSTHILYAIHCSNTVFKDFFKSLLVRGFYFNIKDEILNIALDSYRQQ